MKRIKAQIDDELSGVRVSPELRRSLIRAAEREARRQRRRRNLALGGGVAGIAAMLVLVCGLAMAARGFRPVPGGDAGDPIRPLSLGQPDETGAPPLSDPNETPAILLPTADGPQTALPTEVAESLADQIHARLYELAAELGIECGDAQLQSATQGLIAVAALEGGPEAWLMPIHQILVDDLGLSEAFVTGNGLVDEFVKRLNESISVQPTPAPTMNAASMAGESPDAAPTEVYDPLSDPIRARLIELAEAQGVVYAEIQLQEATEGLTSVAQLDGGPETWLLPIYQTLVNDLGMSEAFVADNGLVDEFAERLNVSISVELTPEPTESNEQHAEEAASVFRVETMNYANLAGNVAQAVFTVGAPNGDGVPQLLEHVTVTFSAPNDDSLTQTARKSASADVNALYQFNRSEATEDGVRVLFMAVLEDPPASNLVMRIQDADGNVMADNLPMDGVGSMQEFSIGLYACEAYRKGSASGLSADLQMDAGGSILLVPPMAILLAPLKENRLVCWSDGGTARYHASTRCPLLGKGSDVDLSPGECAAAGVEPCPECMPEGETAYTWTDWTMTSDLFNDCSVVPCEDGAYLFGWTTMEAFAAQAQQIGGNGKLEAMLYGQRGAGDMAYDELRLFFDSQMNSSRLKSAQQFTADSPTYEQFMGLE